MTDVAVVGAGLIGAAIARRLADAGASVAVVEAARPGGGASLATFAWVNAVGKAPRAYFDLNVEGMAEHRRIRDELDGAAWYHAGGNLEWTTGGDELPAKIERHREQGYGVERMDGVRLGELEPDVALDGEVVAARYADDAWVDPILIIRRMLDHPGIDLVAPVGVTAFGTTGGRVTGVELSDGRRIASDAVVVAAGPDTGELTRRLGFAVPMRHAPGLLVVTEPAPVRVSHMLHPKGVAIRPDGAGRLLLGSDGIDRQIEPAGSHLRVPEATDELMRRAIAVLPRLAGTRVEAVRIGRRALTADGLPAIGPLPGQQGAYVAVTHSGITLGPLIGRLVADELRGTPDPRLEDYRPDRFAATTAG